MVSRWRELRTGPFVFRASLEGKARIEERESSTMTKKAKKEMAWQKVPITFMGKAGDMVREGAIKIQKNGTVQLRIGKRIA